MSVVVSINLTLDKGTDFDETFTIYNQDGSLLDIYPSFVVVSKLRRHPEAKIEYPFDVYIDRENSSVTISMGREMTSQLPSGRCYYDILLTYGYADTTTKKLINGNIIVQDTASI